MSRESRRPAHRNNFHRDVWGRIALRLSATTTHLIVFQLSCSSFRLVVARLDRAIQYSRDSSDRAEKPRRTGCPPSRGMTAEEDVHPHSRGMIYPRFSFRCPSKVKREQGMPGARCTRGLVCKFVRRMRTRAYRFSGGNPAFPAQWVYGLCRALPGDEFVLVTVAADLRLTRPGWIVSATDSLTSATDARTTRFCRTREASFVLRAVVHSRKTALRTNLRADAAASTASHPAFVTIAIRPSCRGGTGRAGRADLPDRDWARTIV